MFKMINSFPFDWPSLPDTLSHNVFLNHQDAIQTLQGPGGAPSVTEAFSGPTLVVC